jgi:hypothetical protein
MSTEDLAPGIDSLIHFNLKNWYNYILGKSHSCPLLIHIAMLLNTFNSFVGEDEDNDTDMGDDNMSDDMDSDEDDSDNDTDE